MSDREAFEVWARAHIEREGLVSTKRDFTLDAGGTYRSATLEHMWECWQAGHATGFARGEERGLASTYRMGADGY